MKNLTTHLRLASLLSSILLAWILLTCTAALGQLTPSGDAYIDTATPTTNYGAKTVLDVESAKLTSYIQFNLDSIPSGYTGSDISQATLKLYVNAVTTAGSFNVDYVNGTWTEATLTADNEPALGNTIAASVPLTTADKNQYILINVTTAVQAWLNGTANDGIALVGNSPLNASFDAKENTTTSHAAELDIVFAPGSGGGTITGVTAGTGLTGGGTTGTVTLSNTGVLSLIASTGISVSGGPTPSIANTGLLGLSAGTGIVVGGGQSPTLSVNTAVVPQLAAANTFTGNQTVNGNLSATGVVTGSSFQIGSNPFDYGSYSAGNAFLGFAGSVRTTGISNTASGVGALGSNTNGDSNTANGAQALQVNTGGTYNTASGSFALGGNTTGNSNTASGYEALITNTAGSGNTGFGTNAGSTFDGSAMTGISNTFLGFDTSPSTGTLSNATAIGANALVAESNAMVLGEIKDVNGANASTYVGIGTTTPQANLDVAGLNLDTYIGNPGCGSGSNTFAGIAFGTKGFQSCTNWSLVGDGSNTYVAAPGSGAIIFRVNSNNTTAMVITSNGDVSIPGNLSKGSGSFKIDHPLDPANKYLYHSFVESPDMMNVYNGAAILDQHGAVWIALPEYFEALNRDFRYQLSSIGRPQPNLYVAKEVSGNRFKISGGKPGAKVSWQVTGIRHDAYADAHRIPNEEEKPPQEQGKYLHPELFGATEEQAIGYIAPQPSSATARAQVASAGTVSRQAK